MVGTNKILTVSYGTFACTLEGFDDSFDTMKAIAEYFRDLAADDRYFGAEPPTPDAELLARIAEKEVHRRVSAEVSADGVHLRTAPPQAAPAVTYADMGTSIDLTSKLPGYGALVADLTVPEVAVEKDGVTVETVLDEPTDDEPLADFDIAAAEPEDEPDTILDDEPIGLEELETTAADTDDSFEDLDIGVVEEEPETPESAAEQTGAESDVPLEDAVTEDTLDDMVADTPETGVFDDTSMEAVANVDVEDITTHDDTLETSDVTATDDVTDEDLIEPVEDHELDSAASTDDDTTVTEALSLQSEKPRADSVAAKLARIRAAVARSVAPVQETYEDETEIEDAATIPSQVFEDAFEEDSDLEEMAADSVEETVATEGDIPEFIEHAEEMDAPEDIAETDAENFAALDENPDIETEEKPKESLRARVIKVKKSAIGDALRRISGATPPKSEPPVAEPKVEQVSVETSLSDEAEADLMRELAEVEAELMGDQPSLDTTGDAEDDDALGRALSDPAKTPAIDEEIIAALGHLDLDMPDVGPSAAQEAPAPEAASSNQDDDIAAVVANLAKTEAAAERRTAALNATEHEEDRVNRLLDQTNSALERHENKRRRSAIAHLKAAVLATKAENEDGPQPVDNPEDLYRADLAQVVRPVLRDTPAPTANSIAPEEAENKGPVRPTRKAVTERRTERPRQPERAASPLMLVSEQRVDASKASADRGPIVPRRVTKGHLADETDQDTTEFDQETADILANSTTFSDFSEKMGASGLHELLECAAAYTSQVEGRQHFSHPDILRRVRQMDGQADLSREDSLRTFGQLLRQGKIRKVKRGQFTISQTSRYIQESRSVSS